MRSPIAIKNRFKFADPAPIVRHIANPLTASVAIRWIWLSSLFHPLFWKTVYPDPYFRVATASGAAAGGTGLGQLLPWLASHGWQGKRPRLERLKWCVESDTPILPGEHA
ncbi:hypothetical protein VTN00DRAFT_5220 [Thermoascus crustaceus]|uniref:uncharacterized protein n=1 Tax=Thermoascus crustaceus TaxID=5088 RepID=UPI00374311D4